MIGENGAGKTSLLEVFSLLADSAKGKLQLSMSRLGGIQVLLTIEKSKKISFGLSILGSDKHPIYYDVSLQPKGNSYEISSEKLYQKDQSFDYIQSEGMLRFLWLVTILYCSESNSITLVDEPEVSLHPQLLCILSDIFREVSRKTHLFIATHSCRLIRFMHPSEVIVIDSENGQSQLKWADNLSLDNWLNEYNLDD
jgi:predicted ATPase